MIDSTILRRPQVQAACGLSRSSIYAHVKLGIFPRPVRIGQRSIGWPSREIEALNTARIAGVDDTGIRQLVVQLHADRLAPNESRRPREHQGLGAFPSTTAQVPD